MLALLCGGQGLLSADMFRLTAERPEAAPVFAVAETLLSQDPRDLVRTGEAYLLHANRTGQILSATAVLALGACLADALPEQVAIAGYSVGEMAAWSLAGIWTSQAALRLTELRARAMDEAGGSDGQLGYVRGLNRPSVEALAKAHHCAIAIINPGNLYVVGGGRADVTALCEGATAAGAVRAGLLEVAIASHTPRLTAAVTPFRMTLDAAALTDPKPGRHLLSGGTGARIFRAARATAGLAAQIATPIDWAATLDALVEAGADRFLDLGPGHALADMASSAFPALRSYAADGFRSVEGLRTWISTDA